MHALVNMGHGAGVLVLPWVWVAWWSHGGLGGSDDVAQGMHAFVALRQALARLRSSPPHVQRKHFLTHCAWFFLTSAAVVVKVRSTSRCLGTH